jgi:hypothetical protein
VLKSITKGTSLSQERKRRTIDTDDGTLSITTIRRRRKLSTLSLDPCKHDRHGKEFLADLTYKSKTKKKMLTLSVNQGQLLLDRFTSMLPRVVVSNILPNDSLVFEVAYDGSVGDLRRLLVEGKASLHDRDQDGWSLLHVGVFS